MRPAPNKRCTRARRAIFPVTTNASRRAGVNSTLDLIMGPNDRFKAPISVISLATITVAAILLTIFVITNGHAEAEQVLLVFALILFGPVSLLYRVLDDPWPITVEAIVLLTATPGLAPSCYFLAIKVFRHFETTRLVFVGGL